MASFPSSSDKSGSDTSIDLSTRQGGKLFFHLLRILRKARPKMFVFENVKGLMSLDEGSHFERIIHLLEESGYRVTHGIVDAAWMLPQMRERVYFVGVRRDLLLKRKRGQVCEVVTKIGPSQRRTSYLARQEEKLKSVALAKTKPGSTQPNCVDVPRKVEEQLPRFFSPRECCRLQGFPESFQIPCSDDNDSKVTKQLKQRVSQFYRQVCNAVSPPCVAAVAQKQLKRYFRRRLVLLTQFVMLKMWIVQYKVYFCSHVYIQTK
ncbi:cytosine-C5 specific DNA methylase [Skeletonema marinoi]|uniref:DNA (cytosine-5-)-methyltransferase n=1 Tax=Skeletonema marinoi TaxID=267567 RepID=A0AAD9DF21_9STRA|nr:cytosine-C5 specific DNA methylase [Skeletonema marinoi]